MIRPVRTRVMAGLAVLTAVAGLSACGSSPPSTPRSAPTTSPPPGAGDTSICQLVTKATAAYAAKNYGVWRSYMTQIGAAADSAQYLPLKTYAEEIKKANSAATTTTTKPKSASKPKRGERVNIGDLLGELGGFVGLKHVCARLASPGSAASSAQGASAQHGQSSVRGTGGHPPTQKGSSRGKVTVGF
jgi:hypothetical protein